MQPISFVICNHNALDYFRLCYQSVRSNLGTRHEIVLLDDGSTDGSREWMRSLKDPNLVRIENGENVGIAYSYNTAVDAATNDLVCVLHSDMYVPPGFDAAMLRGMERHDFIAAYRAEPALYPPSADKAVADFGTTVDDFDEAGFVRWCGRNAQQSCGREQPALFFPWMTTKALYCELGGVDLNYLKYMVDDDDLYLRVALSGASWAQIMDAAVYHFGSRSTRFAGDRFEDRPPDAWAKQYARSQRNFVRKWGVVSTECWTADMGPRPPRCYDTDLIVAGADLRTLHALEPFFSHIWVDDAELRREYLGTEQHNTLMDLSDRVRLLGSDRPRGGVVAHLDLERADEQALAVVQNLPRLLDGLSGPGSLRPARGLTLRVRDLSTHEGSLVVNTRRFAHTRGMPEREFGSTLVRPADEARFSDRAARGSRIPPAAAASTTHPRQ